ncbi:hypothetical protein Tco_1207096 [Tanacetum coccineum]
MEKAATTASILEVVVTGAKIPYLGMQKLKLETIKTTQAKEIASLKKRVKKLERKRKSKNSKDEFIQDCAIVDEVSTGDAVNTAGTEVNTASELVTTTGVSVSTVEPITTASVNITTAGVSVSTAKPITTASVIITTAEPITPPTTTTTTVFEDKDLTIA